MDSDERNDSLIQPFNVVELGKKIDILLSDKQRAVKMGERGYQLYKERFARTTLLDRLTTVYADIAGVGL